MHTYVTSSSLVHEIELQILYVSEFDESKNLSDSIVRRKKSKFVVEIIAFSLKR